VLVRPDEGTIWALHALSDPEGAGPLTLALPMGVALTHFHPDPVGNRAEHPFLSLPKLHAQLQPKSGIELLTSLTVDSLDDAGLLALKWCTHLSLLRTDGCGITENGIRLAASALELPGTGKGEGKGMWRLRGWYARGCLALGDRSMKSLARWPGLVLLGELRFGVLVS